MHSTTARTGAKPARKAVGVRLWQQRYLFILVVPAIIWMLVFNYAPMYGILIAFKDYNIGKGITMSSWAGLKHFAEIVNDPYFFNALRNTLLYSFINLIIGFPIPIIFALLLNELNRFLPYKKFVQTVSYLPYFLSWAFVASYLMSLLSDTGLVNSLLKAVGLLDSSYSFLGNNFSFIAVMVVTSVWKSFGYGSIIYLAAITSIDQTMYEAAIIDGAGRWQRIWHITLPSIQSTIVILLIMQISGIINSNFEQFYLLQNPMVKDVARVIDVYTYEMGFEKARFSYGAAVGLFKSVVSLALLVSANKISNKLTGDGIM
ncbi:MAG: ABC transporter permease [Oscillospiraceae bacterium]